MDVWRQGRPAVRNGGANKRIQKKKLKQRKDFFHSEEEPAAWQAARAEDLASGHALEDRVFGHWETEAKRGSRVEQLRKEREDRLKKRGGQ